MSAAGYLRIFALLAMAKVAVWLVPFSRIARLSGWEEGVADAITDPQQLTRASEMGAAFETVARFIHLPLQCLPCAIACKRTLDRAGIATTLRLGISKLGIADHVQQNERHKHMVPHALLTLDSRVENRVAANTVVLTGSVRSLQFEMLTCR